MLPETESNQALATAASRRRPAQSRLRAHLFSTSQASGGKPKNCREIRGGGYRL
jgi:hypothetical protein